MFSSTSIGRVVVFFLMWDDRNSNLNLQSEYIQKRIHTVLQDLLDIVQL